MWFLGVRQAASASTPEPCTDRTTVIFSLLVTFQGEMLCLVWPLLKEEGEGRTFRHCVHFRTFCSPTFNFYESWRRSLSTRMKLFPKGVAGVSLWVQDKPGLQKKETLVYFTVELHKAYEEGTHMCICNNRLYRYFHKRKACFLYCIIGRNKDVWSRPCPAVEGKPKMDMDLCQYLTRA